MRPALDPAGHRVPRTKPTCLLHTWRPHRQRPFALVLLLHQHESSRNLHLQYLAKNQSTQRCQSIITQGSDHPPVLEPHMVLNTSMGRTTRCGVSRWRRSSTQRFKTFGMSQWTKVMSNRRTSSLQDRGTCPTPTTRRSITCFVLYVNLSSIGFTREIGL
jgi:hypothetical protein